MSLNETLSASFQELFKQPSEGEVRAPGRVNLIGEHTDYNDGFCLPMAIERAVHICWSRHAEAVLEVASLQQDGVTTLTYDNLSPQGTWTDYVAGCADILQQEGLALTGCRLLITGDVPLGSGLSSSAALEVAVIHALLQASGLQLDSARIAQLAQRAENEFVGTNCGILDQLSSSCGMLGQAMLMDCRSLELTPAPLPEGYSVVIADTGKRRGLVDSAYNERRAQCEAGAAAVGVTHLRDADLHQLRAAWQHGVIDEVTFRRCACIVMENGRTTAAAACLKVGDVATFGMLMDQSHLGLRDWFEVTGDELDTMVSLARALPGCVGSRMTGAGFGGCTVSLVADQEVEAFVDQLLVQYKQQFDLPAAVYVTSAAAGAGCFDEWQEWQER